MEPPVQIWTCVFTFQDPWFWFHFKNIPRWFQFQTGSSSINLCMPKTEFFSLLPAPYHHKNVTTCLHYMPKLATFKFLKRELNT